MPLSAKNKIILIISIIETIYLIYMFHFFKTHLDFNFLPQLSFTQKHDFFKHLNDDTYGLRICPFGRIIIFLLIGILLLRNFVIYGKISKIMMIVVLVITFLLSLMNLNALVFLIPVFILEICILIFFEQRKNKK